MQDAVTWAALIASLGALGMVATFWLNRGKAEGEVRMKADAAQMMATSALAKAELIGARLAETREQYASHADLAAAEVRFTTAVNSVRDELRGMNGRLDRVIEGYSGKN